ncbi:hypothetical protein ACKWRH_21895 [Bradyrhizobium sp. Pa8]|uniref:hypothetical protein n=1 Tax=Bradyrhizobium sp. Pa8 TaxID=3386552 RepID=UPI00403F1447
MTLLSCGDVSRMLSLIKRKPLNTRDKFGCIRRRADGIGRSRTTEKSAPGAEPEADHKGDHVGMIDDTPIDIASASARLRRPKKNELHIIVAKAVLAKMAHDGEQLINTVKGSWSYRKGTWELRTDADWLEVRVQDAGERLGFTVNNKLRSEARSWIERRPELWREDEIQWDQHGKIPTRSGLVDPRTGALEPARPDHFCKWRIEVDYDATATCPWWEIMINDMFGDRDPQHQRELVGVVQELMGAALIDKKPRALSKACVFWGIENRAKSGVLEVVTGLFGGNPIAASISSLDGNHGTMPFLRRAPWVLHEAFNPGQWHFSSTVKAIVTGEPIGMNVKNGPYLTQVAHAPIFWATNHPPQFKEATKAIVSRMVVIEVTRAFSESKPIGAAAEAIKRGFSKPGEFVVATELPGILNWAIAGLKRALERGAIATTESIAETAKAIHEDSNVVAGFLSECVEFDPNKRLKTNDFCLAHSAWWSEQKSERRLPSNVAIGNALKMTGDARIAIDRVDLRENSSRYYCGMKLNAMGLRYHKAASESRSRMFEAKKLNTSDAAREVNGFIPPSWDGLESIIKMRKAFERHDRVQATVTEPVMPAELVTHSA